MRKNFPKLPDPSQACEKVCVSLYADDVTLIFLKCYFKPNVFLLKTWASLVKLSNPKPHVQVSSLNTFSPLSPSFLL